jgi:hypothetical protein
VAAIGRADITLARLDSQAIGPHHARHTLVIDEVASSVKLMRYSAISIAGQFVLDVLDKRNKLSIVKMQITCRGSVVERASREIDHFAAPPDRAGRGPVTMEDFSLSPAIDWRGVFLTRSSSIVSWPTLRSTAAMCASYSAMTLASASSSLMFATVELRQPQLDEAGRNAVSALRITAPDDAISDILT